MDYPIAAKIKENVSLAPLTTFKIGGPAEYFVEVAAKDELAGAVAWAHDSGREFHILAGGSNVIVNDNGVDGLVIRMNNDKIEFRGDRVVCNAGASFSRAVRMACGRGLTGLEWAVGIPGTVGGAVRGNAGAFGHAIAERVETAEVFDLNKQKFSMYSRRDCKFDYKESIIKKNKDLLVWEVILKLERGDMTEINKLIDDYSSRRGCSQPRLPSAGCVFKNITVKDLRAGNAQLAGLADKEGIVRGGMVSAGWVIDQLGIGGKTIGGAKVSLEHANFIVNTGRASAEDVIMLSSYIKQQVRDKFGIQLNEEIEYLGY